MHAELSLPRPGGRAPVRPAPSHLRFVVVLLLGESADGLPQRERHALPPEVSDAEETLCGLPRPGAWDSSGFTSRPVTLDCDECRGRAAAMLPHAIAAT